MKYPYRQALQCAGLCAGSYLAWRGVAAWQRHMDFHDRVVLITGGSRGLGLVMARQFVAEGARLAICARNKVELERARDEFDKQGAKVLAEVCDVTFPHQVQAFCSIVRNELGPVDVLVNNAGVIQVGPARTITFEDYDEALAVHFWGALHAIDAVLPDMQRRREGRIVNIASIGGEFGVPHMAPYCASKFALVGLSETLRSELQKDGIHVTTVCPGMVRTGSSRNAWFKGRHRSEHAWFSVIGSLPGFSMSAERAARQIINACRYGRAKITLSLPAKLAAVAARLAPELFADVVGLADWLLPRPGGVGTASLPGSQSASRWSPSILTALSDRAALRNNEVNDRRNGSVLSE